MAEKLLLICVGVAIGVFLVGGIALIVAIGNDHEYLDYPPEEMEWNKWKDEE